MSSALLAQSVAEKWTSGDWIGAIFKPYIDLLGEPLVGTILGGAIVIGFWIYANDLAMPAVVLLLLSGVIIGFLPGDIAGIAQAFLVLAGLSALLEVARRYVL